MSEFKILNWRALSAHDEAALDDFITTAFETASHADGTEADIARGLRRDPRRALDFEREFVAVNAHDDSEILGHILLSRTMINAPSGAVPAVLLAPLSVKNERRRLGIGSALLEQAVETAKAAGERWMVVLGDPAYYGRFGFRLFNEYGLRVAGDAKDELLPYSQLLPLGKGDANALSGGRVDLLLGELEEER